MELIVGSLQHKLSWNGREGLRSMRGVSGWLASWLARWLASWLAGWLEMLSGYGFRTWFPKVNHCVWELPKPSISFEASLIRTWIWTLMCALIWTLICTSIWCSLSAWCHHLQCPDQRLREGQPACEGHTEVSWVFHETVPKTFRNINNLYDNLHFWSL